MLRLQTLKEFITVEKKLKDRNGPNFKDQKFIDEGSLKKKKKTRQLFQKKKKSLDVVVSCVTIPMLLPSDSYQMRCMPTSRLIQEYS